MKDIKFLFNLGLRKNKEESHQLTFLPFDITPLRIPKTVTKLIINAQKKEMHGISKLNISI